MMVGWRMERRQTALHYPHSPMVSWPVGTPAEVPSVGSMRHDKLPAWMRRVIATFRSWHRNVRARRELLQLNDHELRDIGLTRVEALYEASRPFWDSRRGPTL
jgi:uncharacterized protein YjiS (DUF1127 family)